MLKKILLPFASLRLTLVLLAMSILLVYAGTWAQVDSGIWAVQKKYFHSFYTWIEFRTMLPRPSTGRHGVYGGFPFPGGYTLGALMLINLVAAHVVRFKFTLKRSGVILIHLGLVLLIVGELFTSLLATESQMTIDEGSTAIFTQDTRAGELVVIDPSVSTDKDLVVSFPQGLLKTGVTLSHVAFPFEIKIDQFYPNSSIIGPMQTAPGVKRLANAGSQKKLAAVEEPPVSGTEAGTSDVASAYVTIKSPGHDLGTYLVSSAFDGNQEIHVQNKTYLIALRFQRHYKPYSMKLLKFSHDRFVGTDLDRNFSSSVQLVDPANGVDRQVLIRMNEPLRYNGETFYQASFKANDKTTVLQVVHNPASAMPYIACVVGALGMLIHFGIMLVTAILKRPARRANAIALDQKLRGRSAATDLQPAKHSLWNWIAPILAGGVGVLLVVSYLFIGVSSSKAGDFDYQGFGNLPVMFDGRVMPYDSLARTSLQVLLGRDSTRIGSETGASDRWSKIPYSDWKPVPATRWLLDALSGSDKSPDYRIFRIDNPELLGMLSLEQDRSPRIYSYREVMTQFEKLREQVIKVDQIPAKNRGPFERKVAELSKHIELYARIAQLDKLYLVPPISAGEEWEQIGQFLSTDSKPDPEQNEASAAVLSLLYDFHAADIKQFNTRVKDLQQVVADNAPAALNRTEFEAFFNRFDPFVQAQILYVLIFILGCISWLGWAKPLGRAAFVLLIFGLILHTFGLASRIYISGRPPVTNLYSSAVFIAWAGIIFAIGLELYFRNVIAMVCASAMGFLSLLIAHHLAGEGDTMQQLRAVLDTNFWLATHVVCITLGYSATFLAGVLAVAYIFMGVFTTQLTAAKPGRIDEDAPAKLLPRMVYAILCFAILFSFVGTVLGGIWADQSWGRFWGWDPKENGAVLIVLWNAVVLHARWSGVAHRRGVMCLAVFGNVITSWSWFGTNMLGVGLHAYGFVESALNWLLVFVVSQLVIISIGCIPLNLWRSFQSTEGDVADPHDPADRSLKRSTINRVVPF